MHSDASSWKYVVVCSFLVCFFFSFSLSHASVHQQIKATSETLVSRIAPGEVLPLSVSLTNFGNTNRADVTLYYSIFNANAQEIATQSETVAVETTAEFIAHIPIPSQVPVGDYTAYVRIEYDGQEVPATASYQFRIEKKIGSIFISDAIGFFVFAIIVLLVLVLLLLLFLRNRRTYRGDPHSYKDKPRSIRVYYEIISDTIHQMRSHEGDRAIDLAMSIPGLVVDIDNGRVLDITDDPSLVVANLVSKYKKTFGADINMSFRAQSPRALIHRSTHT